MEKCIITKKLLPDDDVVLTLEGPIAVFLWGRKPVKQDSLGLSLIPVNLLDKLKKALGRDPVPEVMEDGGKCLYESI